MELDPLLIPRDKRRRMSSMTPHCHIQSFPKHQLMRLV